MSFFKKILTSVGIGGAEINTEISQSRIRVGENITGIVNIRGGSLEQKFSSLEVELKVEYYKEVDDSKVRHTATITKIVLDRNISLAPNETRQIPFSFKVPEHSPISMNKRNIWVETELEMPLGLDPEDRDYVDILPSNSMEVILDAVINKLGFRLREVECYEGYLQGSRSGLLQEFEFVPQSAFRGMLDELEITFLPDLQGITLYMQIDKRTRNLGSLFQEMVGLDEKRIRLTISNSNLSQGSDYIAEIIKNTVNKYCK